jgi:hypothetical protein
MKNFTTVSKETKCIVTPIPYRSSTNVCSPLELQVVYLMHSCLILVGSTVEVTSGARARSHAHSASDSVS